MGLASEVCAQSISASPYSVYGVGLLKSRNSAQNRAMAGTGIGVRDRFNLNTLNPASYSSINPITQIFEIGMFMERDRYETDSRSSSSVEGNLTTVNYWFRFSKKWAGNFGLAPFSNVNYNITSARRIGADESSTITYNGNGGLSEFYFGNGYQVTKNLSLGATVSYIFGSLEKTETIASGTGAGIGVTNKIRGYKLTGDMGAQYSIFLSKNRSVSIGLTYNPRFRMNTDRDVTAHESFTADTLWTEELDQRDYILPERIGSGLSFQTQRSVYAVDVTYSGWSKARLEDGLNLRNTMRFSLGFEHKGSGDADSYLQNIQLRTGFYVERNYLVLSNTTFNDWGFSLGLGLPLFENRGIINLSYNFNRSGTINNNLILQRADVFVLEFTFRDIWGIRRKFD